MISYTIERILIVLTLWTVTPTKEPLRFNYKRSRPEALHKIAGFKNSAKFRGKHLSQSLSFNKDAGLSPQLYYKRDFGTGIFLWILRNI